MYKHFPPHTNKRLKVEEDQSREAQDLTNYSRSANNLPNVRCKRENYSPPRADILSAPDLQLDWVSDSDDADSDVEVVSTSFSEVTNQKLSLIS